MCFFIESVQRKYPCSYINTLNDFFQISHEWYVKILTPMAKGIVYVSRSALAENEAGQLSWLRNKGITPIKLNTQLGELQIAFLTSSLHISGGWLRTWGRAVALFLRQGRHLVVALGLWCHAPKYSSTNTAF